jgi:hypothetical protein
MLQKLNEPTVAVMHRPGTIAEWEELERKMHYLDGLPVSWENKACISLYPLPNNPAWGTE